MNSTIVENNGAFIETDATIMHDGLSFSSGGSWLCKCIDTGKYQGLMYAFPKNREIGSWDGSIKIPAYYSHVWQSNFGDWRQSVYFTHEIDGIKRYFYGVYMRQNSDMVYVYERKAW